MKYETHIVGFKGSLTEAPKPFFLNNILVAAQGFTGIATVEGDSLEEVYAAWQLGCEWAHKQVELQPDFGCHVKLEEVQDLHRVSLPPNLDTIKVLDSKNLQKIQSSSVPAWDIHLDGQFVRPLQDYLLRCDYIQFDYLDQENNPTTTMTLHFLNPEPCVAEYRRILDVVLKTGGFDGVMYWEHPLGFVVYGDTLPRPIIK